MKLHSTIGISANKRILQKLVKSSFVFKAILDRSPKTATLHVNFKNMLVVLPDSPAV